MLKNYLIVTFRSLFRQKSFSLINILGLVVGLTCSLLILLWVQYQYSYNNFHSKANTIHQLVCNVDSGQKIETWKGVPYPYSQSLKSDFPEVENVVVKTRNREKSFKINSKNTSEIGFYANETFFQVLTLKFTKNEKIESFFICLITFRNYLLFYHKRKCCHHYYQ